MQIDTEMQFTAQQLSITLKQLADALESFALNAGAGLADTIEPLIGALRYEAAALNKHGISGNPPVFH